MKNNRKPHVVKPVSWSWVAFSTWLFIVHILAAYGLYFIVTDIAARTDFESFYLLLSVGFGFCLLGLGTLLLMPGNNDVNS